QQVSPDEKIFTPADERGFPPHTLPPRKTFCRKPQLKLPTIALPKSGITSVGNKPVAFSNLEQTES
ncbi:hypothetical protein MAE30S32_18540, partial [Microcystis aeruginosa 11-30S32]